LARKKFISDFLTGLLESKKVQFQEIALHIDSPAKNESIERKIQYFFNDYEFDYEQVYLLLILFLPKGRVSLSIDRTEWDFGVYQCNILMIVAKNGKVGIPLYRELLDNKSGDSNCDDRIDLLEKVVKILGKDRINMIVGDSEFIGLKWIKYLKINDINYCMRVPKSHSITLKNGEIYFIAQLLKDKTERYFEGCMVDGVWGNTMMKRLSDGDFLFLIGNFPAKQLGGFYRRRWCIEVLFQTFKERGFDLESTHLKCDKKLSKLLVFVSIAVAICVKVGECHHKKVQKIKIKKHGCQAKSFFRKGLDILREAFKKPSTELTNFCLECLRTFERWIRIQTSYNQIVIKIFG